ncbi:MAG: hypothetical protein AAGI91_13010 [Bacteroidota bacterium]
MEGIQFIVDERGERTAVVIDLAENGAVWEDFYDHLLAQQRRNEPRASLDAVRQRLTEQGKLLGDE